jgi:GNAT superfamily N-acetyltransferase
MEILRRTPEFKPSEVSVAEEVIDSYLHNPDSYNIFTAGAYTDIAGFICYGLTPLTEATWDIYWLVVSPDKRGQGAGSALMTFAEEKIKKGGGRLVIIETSAKPGYEKTRHFYLKHEYEIVCRIADFYAPDDDKIILQKRIN